MPTSLGSIHPVFHMSVLNRCMDDPSLIVPVADVGITDSWSYEEVPIEIMDRQVCRLRTKDIASVLEKLKSRKGYMGS